jgi:hypothetical protein
MPATQPNPISLSDSQLQQVMTACQALQPAERSAFLSALAHRLRGEVIGDGTVARAIRELIRPGEFFHPPQLGTQPHAFRPTKLTSGEPIA